MNPVPRRISPAVLAEVLYLVNLLLAPGLAFLALLVLFRRHRASADALTRIHVRQSFAASVVAGMLLVVVPGLIALTGDLSRPGIWTLLLLYFVSCHAGLVMLGVLALARALAGKPCAYPLPGALR
ncbi:MAG: hypothetical protein BGP21_08645 [Thiobacillus sp. 65-29]|jgi:hypothetical protein|nr:MAG: hypothetical protein BGP21_08645 [Thiobacillus sp. 65-29]